MIHLSLRKSIWVVSVLLLLLCGVVLTPYMTKTPVPDESTFLYEGLRIVNGDLPYRDFFEFIWPGTLYLVALLIKLSGGVSLFTMRLVALAALITCAAVTLNFGKKYLPLPWLIWLGFYFWLANIPWGMEMQHHLFSTTTGMLAVFFVLRFLDTDAAKKNRIRSLSAAGLCCGLTIVFTQSLGVLLSLYFTGFLLGFARNLKRFIIFFALPLLLPPALVVSFFISQDALGDFRYSTFTWLFEGGYTQTTSHLYFLDGFTKLISYSPHVLKHVGMAIDSLLLVLKGAIPILGLVWGLLWPIESILRNYFIGKRVTEPDQLPLDLKMSFLFGVGLIYFISTFSYPWTVLVTYHSWIFAFLAVFALHTILSRGYPKLEKGVLTLGFVLLALVFARQIEQALGLYERPKLRSYGTVEKFLTPVGYSDASVNAINQMTAYMHETAGLETAMPQTDLDASAETAPETTAPQTLSVSGKNLFIYNSSPEFYLLTGLQNPTRYEMLMKLYNTDKQIADAVQSIQTAKPLFVLYDQADIRNFKFDLRFSEVRSYNFLMMPLLNELAANYDQAGAITNQGASQPVQMLLMKRKAS